MKKTVRVICSMLSASGFVFCFLQQASHAQLRVVSYNTAGGARSGIEDVFEAIGNEVVNAIAKPIDVLSLQEQSSSSSTTQSLVNILNSIYGAGTYARATLDGGTSGGGRPGLIYNTNTVSLESQIAFGTVNTSAQARQTLRYQLRPVGYDSSADFYLYSNHYKASTGSSNQARRLVEASAVRSNADALGEGTHIIYSGDFNIRSSSESAYRELLSSGNGQAFDPLDAPGTWHDSFAFRSLHTQAPSSNPSGGLIGGGIDDRFDFQLVTGEFLDNEGLSYIEGSYHTFGNNGTHNLNGSISTGSGATSSILNALESASDHLPVVADYQLPAIMDAFVSTIPSTISIGEIAEALVTVENIADVVSPLGADELDYTVSVTGDLSGFFSDFDFALDGGNTHAISLDTSSVGLKSGNVVVETTSQSAANSFLSFPINFEVIGVDSADFDQDLDIDGADFLTWQRGFGTGVSLSEGDANSSNSVDSADLAIWQQQYGSEQLLQQATVPEPSTLLLMLLGMTISTTFINKGRNYT